MRNAVIWGVTGQSGSYLAEHLLEKGFNVIGVSRRTSTCNKQRILHLIGRENFIVVEGDITDFCSVGEITSKYKSDMIFNLAAMSHVFTSFHQPRATFEINAIGVLNILESIRQFSPNTKYYQASTTELFASNYDVDKNGHRYQDEHTILSANSPYAAAKLCAHHLVGLYRNAYKIFGCCGILANHETLTYGMPMIVKQDGLIDIRPIGDIARYMTGIMFDLNKKEYQSGKPIMDLEVWSNNKWSKVTYVSGYPYQNDKNLRIVNARNFVYSATGDHICFMDNGIEKTTSNINVEDRVLNIDYPTVVSNDNITREYAEFLGMLVGDGNLSHCRSPRLTNKNKLLKQRFIDLWLSFAGDNAYYKYEKTFSGFTGEEIGRVTCYSDKVFDFDIYTDDISVFGHRNKKVPKCILNSSTDIMEAFLVGYNACDGLKMDYIKYKFQNFKTNSMSLASGLLFIISKITGQKYNITVEESWKWGKRQFYFSINLLTTNKKPIDKYNEIIELVNNAPDISQREIYRRTGISRTFIRKVFYGYQPPLTHHSELLKNEVKKIIEIPDYNGWLFDLETEDGCYYAGIGQGLLHNSPRRGEEFVTRKITKWISEFKFWLDINNLLPEMLIFEYPKVEIPKELLGCSIQLKQNDYILAGDLKFPKLRLGNLNATRDWSHAKDMVRGMLMILEQDKPDDYMLGSEKSYTVRQFCETAFGYAGISDFENYIYIDPQFFRPVEVEYLCGRSTKAHDILGWYPEISFNELVREMVEHDIAQAKKRLI